MPPVPTFTYTRRSEEALRALVVDTVDHIDAGHFGRLSSTAQASILTFATAVESAVELMAERTSTAVTASHAAYMARIGHPARELAERLDPGFEHISPGRRIAIARALNDSGPLPALAAQCAEAGLRQGTRGPARCTHEAAPLD